MGKLLLWDMAEEITMKVSRRYIRVDKQGRMTIPKKYRNILGIEEGTTLLVTHIEGSTKVSVTVMPKDS